MRHDKDCDVTISAIALIACLFVLLCTLTASAQRQGAKPSAVGTVYEWKPIANEDDQLALLKNGKQIGAWSVSGQFYRPIVAGAFGEQTDPPFPPPEWAVRAHDEQWEPKNVHPVLNFGITPREQRDGSEHVAMSIDGRPADRAQVLHAIENGPPADSHKYRLTFIGSEAEREKVQKDFNTLGGDLKDKVLVWSVPPDHWSLRDNVTGQAMFVTSGKPTVYLTDPAGVVLYHEDDYLGPSDFEAIRKRIAEYEAKRDPGRTLPGVSASVHPSLLGGGTALAMAAGLYFSRRKK